MPKKKLRVDVVTIFPEIVEPYLHASILGRAGKKKLAEFHTHDLRQWTTDKHRTVDDKPFGGGPGMVMKVEPFHKALMKLKLRKANGTKTATAKKTRVILTSAKGKVFTQTHAKRLSKYDRLVFLCGRYEGVDERVAKHLADEEISIGEYVLTGGELPALVVSDAVTRLRPGVLGEAESLSEESHTKPGELEYPQYTRPEVYKFKNDQLKGWSVPPVLLSGDHKKIKAWRKGETRA